MKDMNLMPSALENENLDTITNQFALIQKAMSGDMKFKLSQTTANASAAALAAANVVYKIGVRLESAAGELHDWYNGKVLIAIADDDSTGAAAIVPAAGEVAMVKGELEVTVTLPEAVWTPAKAATLTISDPATASTGILGVAVANATFVARIVA